MTEPLFAGRGDTAEEGAKQLRHGQHAAARRRPRRAGGADLLPAVGRGQLHHRARCSSSTAARRRSERRSQWTTPSSPASGSAPPTRRAATVHPTGSPQLPDLPLGRYTDPAFQALEDEFLFGRVVALRRPRQPAPGARQLPPVPRRRRPDPARARRGRARCGRSATPAATAARRSCAASAGRRGCSCASSTRGATTCPVGWCACPTSGTSSACDTDERGLPPVRCERWGGWHFVNFDDDAVPLAEWLDPIPRLLPEVAAAPLRVIDEKQRRRSTATGRSSPRPSSRCTTPARSTRRPSVRRSTPAAR